VRSQLALLLGALALGACAARLPRPPSAEETFLTHCAACHGALGEGDGPVAATIRGPVPNLRLLARRNGGVFPADRVASYIDGRDMPSAHGERQMPVWGDVFDTTAAIVIDADAAQDRIAALVEYLRGLQVK
jgi:mono/diheme cytochrome c family protein